MINTREQFLLMKLAEECTEVGQRALKQIQFGRDQVQKGDEVKDGVAPPIKEAGLSNGQRLRGEVMDLLALLKLLELNDGFDSTGVIESTPVFQFFLETKVGKLRKYLAYSQELGMIDKGVTL